MIYETADNVMKWIGGGNSGAGEFRGGAEVQGAMQGAVSASRGAVNEAMTGLMRKSSGGGGGGDTPPVNATGGQKQNEGIMPGNASEKSVNANGGAGHETRSTNRT
jgi:hypothetical protein